MATWWASPSASGYQCFAPVARFLLALSAGNGDIEWFFGRLGEENVSKFTKVVSPLFLFVIWFQQGSGGRGRVGSVVLLHWVSQVFLHMDTFSLVA